MRRSHVSKYVDPLGYVRVRPRRKRFASELPAVRDWLEKFLSSMRSGALARWPVLRVQVDDCIHERHMSESLGKISQEAAASRVILFGEEADIVLGSEQPF